MRAALLLVGVALSALSAACAAAPIGSGQQDGPDTGATSSSSTGSKKSSGGSTLDTTPVAATTATSCTNLKACAARATGTDATTFAKVAGEGDADTCTKALSQCTSELSTTTTTPTPVVDAGTPAPDSTASCTALATCCDTLFDAANADWMTCDTVVSNAVDSSCGVSLSAFQTEGTCF